MTIFWTNVLILQHDNFLISAQPIFSIPQFLAQKLLVLKDPVTCYVVHENSFGHKQETDNAD
jgi:hypothetical protein